MTLAKPPLTAVSPGQPITAQAWNALQTAIGQLFDGINAFGNETLTVVLTSGSTAVTDAVVVAVPNAGAPVLAVPPFGSVNAFTLTRLTAGLWTVTVAAPGFAPISQQVTVPLGAPLPLTLTPTGEPMPNLLGRTATEALSILGVQNIAIDGIVDIFGTEISRSALPPDHAISRVLSQFPLPGELVVGASAGTRLVLSAQPPTQKDAAKDTKDASKESKEVTKDVKEAQDTKTNKDKADKGSEKNEAIDKAIRDKVEKGSEKGSEKDEEKAPREKSPVRDKNLEDKDSEKGPRREKINPREVNDFISDVPLGERVIARPLAADLGELGARVFIAPAERPPVGESALLDARDE